ncbi:polysaccharide deacetylase family protein [Anaerovoracaceae bacterium 41-7]|jgi:peptidoglycan/xylan/chitin deacetylase (PgdA/CDA1 family)|uniref:polysaccharide deacetylase family protein n=1 Tax=Senimuribacter intestinalis TaxID=2941507 RepID=UPI002041A1C0|nr:polysaccharide deacetylase family protein [Senimuribacter intestinalis]MCI9476636.1 polysaccharide deacetylase [Emergencia sp.]MCI9639158.1 polysaccharide deacetylase [Emergencia sp.]
MEGRFSVRFFKRLITFTVLGVLLILTVAVIVLSVRVTALSAEAGSGTDSGGNETQNADSALIVEEEALPYQEKYASLYIRDEFRQAKAKSKTVYLTFDDGPSQTCTPEVLDILKEHNIKATFFVVGKISENRDIVQRIIDEGHTIGIHTYTHSYEYVYQSMDTYLADFEKLWTELYEEFSYRAEIFRFPGGSVNTYNYTLCQQIIAEMYRRGFVYFDWNASAEDAASGNPSSDVIAERILNGVHNADRSIVLMHDSASMGSTVEALPEIIEQLQDEGYAFDKLDRSVKPITFSYLK